MSESVERMSTLLFPSVLAAFLALYVVSLLTGVEPEIGLLGAGLAGIVLAVLGRLAIGILEAAPSVPPQQIAHESEVGAVDAELDALRAGLDSPPMSEAGQANAMQTA